MTVDDWACSMAGVYHHIEEYDEKIAPTDDPEVYRNTVPQQTDKRLDQTDGAGPLSDHYGQFADSGGEGCRPVRSLPITDVAKTPVVAKTPDVAKTPVGRPAQQQQEEDKRVVESERKPLALAVSPPTTATKEMEEWRHASQIIKKRMEGATLKLNERRRFLVGSAMAGEYIRLVTWSKRVVVATCTGFEGATGR